MWHLPESSSIGSAQAAIMHDEFENHIRVKLQLQLPGASELYTAVDGILYHTLTHWGRDKMAAFSQTTLSNAFSWMKMLEFRFKFHWSLFIRVQFTTVQHWFRYSLGAGQATSHYLNQWLSDYRRIYVSLGLTELILKYITSLSILPLNENKNVCISYNHYHVCWLQRQIYRLVACSATCYWFIVSWTIRKPFL